MQLYHYTTVVNALLIGMSGEGLKPSTHDYGAFGAGQTMGVPVVWLTKQESNICTPEWAARLGKYPGNENIKVGDPAFGGSVQCIVNVERSRHLIRWIEFMRTTKIVAECEGHPRITAREILACYDMPPGFCEGWWISLKCIPANRVIVPMTPAQAMEACEWQIEKHPDAEARERFKRQRDDFAALDPNALLVFHNGECKVHSPKREAA